MRITQLELTFFRNIDSAVLTPCAGVNIIWGDNAQGKTNLLEGCLPAASAFAAQRMRNA